MKICFVCSEYPHSSISNGGIGTFTQTLARSLVQRGYQVRVVGVYSPKCSAPAYENDHGVQVWRIYEPTHRFGWGMARIQLFCKVSEWAKNGEIEIVEGPDYGGSFAGWPHLSVPVVVRAHGSAASNAYQLGRSLKRIIWWLEKWTYLRANVWISSSSYAADIVTKALQLSKKPDAIIYNFVDEPDGYPLFSDRSPHIVVFAGTLAVHKGVIPLLQAWNNVVASFPSAQLHLYGRDTLLPSGTSMQKMLENMLHDDIRETVHFNGFVDRDLLREKFCMARLSILPSIAEGFALVPLESLMAGCPTIYTCLASGPELITNNVNGLLINPNDPSTITQAILKILQNDQLAERLSKAGYERACKFSLERIVPQNEDFYANVIGNWKTGKLTIGNNDISIK